MTIVSKNSRLVRYAIAVVAVAAATLLRWGLTAWIGPGLATYITYYPAVMLVAMVAGIGPGVLTTVATVLAVQYWLMPVEFGQARLVDIVGQVLFLCVGVVISVVVGLYRRMRDRLEDLVSERTKELKEANTALQQQVALIDSARAEVIAHEMQRVLRARRAASIPQSALSAAAGTKLSQAATITGFAVAFVGLLVLVGWIFNIDMLKRVLSGLVAMKANTAVCFLLAGAALAFRERSWLRLALAAVIGAVAAFSLAEYLTGVDVGLDQLLFADRADAFPGRMAQNTAIAFILSAVALALLGMRERAALCVQQVCAVCVGTIGLAAVLGYAYHAQALYQSMGFTSMALNTAATFVLLAAGLLCARDDGLAGIWIMPGPGGHLARRLLPAALLVPAIVGWVHVLGERAGVYNPTVSSGLFAMTMILAFTAGVLLTARAVSRTDVARRETETQLRSQSELMDQARDALIVSDQGGVIRFWNKGAAELYGWSAYEAVGQRINVLLSTESIPPDHDAALEDAGHWKGELIQTTRSGRRVTIESQKTTSRTADGSVLILQSNRDITVRKQAEEELLELNSEMRNSRRAALNLMDDAVVARKSEEEVSANLRQERDFITAVLDNTGALVVVLSRDGRITRFNPACEKVTGYTAAEVQNRIFWEFLISPEDMPGVKATWDSLAAGAFPNTHENNWLTKTGAKRLVAWTNSVLLDPAGEIQNIISTGIDITELRESQKRETDNLTAYVAAKTAVATVNEMNVGVVLIRKNGQILSVNPTFESMCGCRSADVVGEDAAVLCEMVAKEERNLFLKLLADGGAGRDARSVPLTFVTKLGKDLMAIADVSRIVEPGREQSTIILTVKDITELRQSEAQFRKSQATLAEAQHIAHIGNWDWDIVKNTLEWSDEVYRVFGVTRETFNATYEAFLDRVHPDERRLVASMVNKALEGSASYNVDHRIICPDGAERGVHQQAEVFRDDKGNPVRMLGIVQDITERREAEKRDRIISAFLALFARKESKKEYLRAAVRLLKHASRCQCVGVRVVNADNSVPYEASIGFSKEFLEKESGLFLNRDVCACVRVMVGNAEPQELQMMTPAGSFSCNNSVAFLDSLAEKDRKRFRGNCAKQGFQSIGIIPVRHRDRVLGAIHLADERKDMLSPELTTFMEVLAPLVGEALFRFQVEESLRQAGVHNRSLIEASLDPLVTIDAEGKITDVNAATEKATGCPRTELIGTDFAGYFTNPDLARAVYKQVFHESRVQDYALEIRHRDGRVTPVLYNASVYRDENGGVVGVFAAARDITERKRAEQVLDAYQAELRALSFRLSMAEERARRDLAVALHDTVGQTLAVSKMKLGELGQLITAPDAATALAEIREMFEEAVRQTRTLSFELSPPILYELGLDAALEWLGEEFQKRHGFQFQFQSGEKPLIPEPVTVLIFQAVRELLVNVGKHAKARHVRMVSRMDGPQLTVVVKDDGRGFDLNARAATAAKTNSLGLFSIRERMRHIGGSFTVETEPGHGTTAKLYVPVAENKPRE